MTTPPLTYLAALVDGGGTVPPELRPCGSSSSAATT